MQARVLKFHVWIPHEKIADNIFFFDQDYATFLRYGPLKIWIESFQQAISKTIEARALKFKE